MVDNKMNNSSSKDNNDSKKKLGRRSQRKSVASGNKSDNNSFFNKSGDEDLHIISGEINDEEIKVDEIEDRFGHLNVRENP
jgi:hypothetical protein